MKKQFLIACITLTLILTACTGEIKTSTPLPDTGAAPTQVVGTPTYPPTAVTSQETESPVEGKDVANACVPPVSGIFLPEDIFLNPAFEHQIEAYLNAGGSIRELPAAIKAVEGGKDAKIQVVSADLNNDDFPSVFLAVTLPYGNGDGETHLLFFRCVNGRYQSAVLFRRAGAGNQSEGLYDGGGARLAYVKDFNKDGKTDVMVSVGWKDYTEYYLVTYDGTQFENLLSYRDELGERVKKIPLFDGELKIIDIDGDGIFEIVVYDSDGKVERVWRWDGKYYSLNQE